MIVCLCTPAYFIRKHGSVALLSYIDGPEFACTAIHLAAATLEKLDMIGVVPSRQEAELINVIHTRVHVKDAVERLRHVPLK